MFHIRALRNIDTNVTNQQMHTDKIGFIIYYFEARSTMVHVITNLTGGISTISS